MTRKRIKWDFPEQENLLDAVITLGMLGRQVQLAKLIIRGGGKLPQAKKGLHRKRRCL
jgi:hypothetical protein